MRPTAVPSRYYCSAGRDLRLTPDGATCRHCHRRMRAASLAAATPALHGWIVRCRGLAVGQAEQPPQFDERDAMVVRRTLFRAGAGRE
jgi:hypothetical protein